MNMVFLRLKSIFYTFIFIAFSGSILAQVDFVESKNMITDQFYSGIAVGVSDMNGDWYDDIIVLDAGKDLSISYQRELGHSMNTVLFEEGSSSFLTYSMCVGDINNDFYNDFAFGHSLGGEVFLSDESGFSSYFYEDSIFVQGLNFVDFDQDGLLDLFLSNDVGKNRMFKNNQSSFVEKKDWIDFSTFPVSDNSGNYGTIWMDIDSDGDQDLHISKCRVGVFDEEDPRRINMLYLRADDGTYSEVADEYGLAIGAQTWASAFGDLDNDEDIDAYVVNHGDYFMLMENNENNIFELNDDYLSEKILSSAFQVAMADFDNNSYLDILIGGQEDFLLMNMGNMKFKKIEIPFTLKPINSFSVGDFNDDGFMDVYGVYSKMINFSSGYKDKLFLNEKNDNHYIKFSLTDHDGNKNAVGSRLALYGDWGVQIRNIKAGEGYGIVNSFTAHFGLGQSESIDSLVVVWPNGEREKYRNLKIDKQYFISKMNCATLRSDIDIVGDKNLCSIDSVVLSVEQGSEYYWSNGAISQSIIVKEKGSYFCRYVNEFGCLTWTNVVDVGYEFDYKGSDILKDGLAVICAGDEISLSSIEADHYNWSNGGTTKSLIVDSSGSYSLMVNLNCKEFYSDTFQVEVLDTTRVLVENDTVPKGEQAELLAIGDSIFWYENDVSLSQFYSGDQLIIEDLQSDEHYYVTDRSYWFYDNRNVGPVGDELPSSSLFSANSINAEMVFDVYQPLELKSVLVNTDLEGWRRIEVKNKNDNIVVSKDLFIEEGESRVQLGFELPAGEKYSIGTNGLFNVSDHGFMSPRLWRKKENVLFPYELEGLISVVTSDKGFEYFYYFMDWEVQQVPKFCESEKVLISAILDTMTSVERLDVYEKGLIVKPNPSSDLVFINKEWFGSQYEIVNTRGQVIQNGSVGSNGSISVLNLHPSIYFLRIFDGLQYGYLKFVKL